MAYTTVDVNLEERSYPIYIGEDILAQMAELIPMEKVSQILLVSNETVFPLYGPLVHEVLETMGHSVHVHEVKDGETSKSWDVAYEILDLCVEKGLDRSSVIVALGGGVVGDLAGFVAATYMRGLSFVQVPTTLLAAVDSSVGGKVAVNHPKAKNTLGFFHQPLAVVMDINVLASLPDREYRAGLAEVVKYGVIMDSVFFEYLEKNVSALLKKDPSVLSHVIRRCCELKAEVVEADEKEQSGRRATLNFGHTLGHALEAAGQYTTYLHGEAVSIGMVYAAQLAEMKALCGGQDVLRIQNLLKQLGLPTVQNDFSLNVLYEHLRKDKKFTHDQMTFVLPQGIGSVELNSSVKESDLKGLGL